MKRLNPIKMDKKLLLQMLLRKINYEDKNVNSVLLVLFEHPIFNNKKRSL